MKTFTTPYDAIQAARQNLTDQTMLDLWEVFQMEGVKTGAVPPDTSPEDQLQLAEVWYLAYCFASNLRECLSKQEWREMVELNAIEENEGVCHSHDHCDANVCMIDAWKACGLDDDELFSEWGYGYVNAAWAFAQEHYFKV